MKENESRREIAGEKMLINILRFSLTRPESFHAQARTLNRNTVWRRFLEVKIIKSEEETTVSCSMMTWPLQLSTDCLPPSFTNQCALDLQPL